MDPQPTSPLDTTPRARHAPSVVRAGAMDRDQLKGALRRGKITRVRRGLYTYLADDVGSPDDREREVLTAIAATHEALTTPFWFSHESAALIWGCWHWRLRRRVDLIQTSTPHIYRLPGLPLRRHLRPLPPAERAERSGLPVTSLERTVVDCTRSLGTASGLVVADSALRLGAEPAAIDAILRDAAGGRGVVRARRVLAWADGRSESPGETVTRHHLLTGGLPAPELQVDVDTWLGTFRLDLGYRRWRLGIEFDGAVKYAALPGRDPREVLMEEKRRQDALAEAGWRLLRVTWDELDDPERLVRRVHAALRERPAV